MELLIVEWELVLVAQRLELVRVLRRKLAGRFGEAATDEALELCSRLSSFARCTGITGGACLRVTTVASSPSANGPSEALHASRIR